jgi:hypothetical protein
MKRYFLLATGLLSAVLAWCQSKNAVASGTSSTPHTLLWRITGKGIARPTYLFGTMHILCADEATLSDSLLHVIHSVDEVYFEIDLSDMAGMINSIQYMKMNNGKTLANLLKPDEYKRVKAYFSSHESMLPFSMLEHFKPMLISGLIEEQSLGCATTDGMEMQIKKAIHQEDHSIPIKGLETAEFQASLFDSIPYAKQAKELLYYVDSADQNKQMTRQLADLYSRQDLDGIQALSDKDDPGMSEYMDLLLYSRNRKWARILDTLLPRKSLLIAVGAGHLPGQQGVIELLRKKGYTVEPVFSNRSQSL